MRVLVTGVSQHLAGELARRLQERPELEALIGLDLADPTVALEHMDFVHADTRHSVLAKLVRQLRIDTVLHCAVRVDTPGPDREVHETNVIGTMNVLAACAGPSSPVRRLVVKSSVAVYGAHPDDPSFLREEMAERRPPGDSLERALVEMEQLVQDFALRNPRCTTTVLRLGYRLGVIDPTPLGRYLGLPVVPVFMGFDPRLQFLHEEDAAEAVFRAAVGEHPGVFNVAGDGVLLLSQAIAMAGRRRASVLPPYGRVLGGTALKAITGLDIGPHLADLLAYGLVVDCDRLLGGFGWTPELTTRAVMLDFLDRTGPQLPARSVPPSEYELQAYLQRRRART